VVLVRADDWALEQEVVKGALERVELGALKGNQGELRLACDGGFASISGGAISCEKFHAISGVARMEKIWQCRFLRD